MKSRRKLSSVAILIASSCAVATTHGQADPEQAPLETPEQSAQADIESYYLSLRSARDGLLNALDFDAALNPAELLVEALTEAEHPNLARERIVLAYVLAELERFEEANTEFFESIELIEDELGMYSPELITPMHLLARSYMRTRMFPEAITVLEQAQTVSQRNEGLFNVDQSPLIDDLTTAYLGMGDTLTARDLQVERLENAQRRFGISDPQVIPFHYELANYYMRSRLRDSARDQFEAVLEIQEAQVDPLDPSLLSTLREIAKIDLVLGERKANKERIEEILASNEAIDPLEHAYSLAFLGDWALVDRERRDAADYYQRAFDLLAASGEVDPNEYFADPAVISLIPPLSAVDRAQRRLPYAWGTIVVEFDVSDQGRVTEITGVGAEPSGVMEGDYVDRLEQAVFRPQIVDGEAVDTSGIRFTHYFRYYVEEPGEEAEE